MECDRGRVRCTGGVTELCWPFQPLYEHPLGTRLFDGVFVVLFVGFVVFLRLSIGFRSGYSALTPLPLH